MRELPEPDIISEVKHFACPKCLADLGYQSPIHIGYRRDQVLAIQKQAYEDGLRDAASKNAGKVRALSRRGSGALLDEQQFCFSMGWKEGAASVRKNIRAMLTASKKEPQ